jgi:hypothetical protein
MTTLDAFGETIKAFISDQILGPLAEVSVKNRDADVAELIEKYTKELNLPRATKERKPKKAPSPKAAQRWITYDQYSQESESSFLCGYVQTRGKNKDCYCGIVLDDTNVVKWSPGNGFTSISVDEEFEDVGKKKPEMRCKLCWSRDPKTGEYKRKRGRGEKLMSENKGDIIAPTVIPGVSVPDNAGLMGFLSGNTNSFQSPSRAMGKVIRAKRFEGLLRDENCSHVIPNPDKHPDMPWLIRDDEHGKTVIGKFSYDITSESFFEENYLDDLIELTDNDIKLCKEYNISYEFHTKTDDMDLPVVKDPEEHTTTIQDEEHDELDIPTIDMMLE